MLHNIQVSIEKVFNGYVVQVRQDQNKTNTHIAEGLKEVGQILKDHFEKNN